MKFSVCILLTLIATASLPGCTSGSNAATATAPPPAAAVTGIDTPKSVSVVTAN
ncbi:MAG TPA: hypothetical protein VGO37_10240 [Steroidobacteraceae bacterium]|nr:hypothetical protein [Steroidobacteraceae bacterium]